MAPPPDGGLSADGGWLRLIFAAVLTALAISGAGFAATLLLGIALAATGPGPGPAWMNHLLSVAVVALWSPLVAWAGFVPGLPLAARALRRGRLTALRAAGTGMACGAGVGALLATYPAIEAPSAYPALLLAVAGPCAVAGALYGVVLRLWLGVVLPR